jgi:hypothetical protein
MLGDLQNYLRRKRLGIGITFSVFLLLFAFLFFYEPSTPDGVYYDENIACGHGCWIFKNGKVFVECEDHSPDGAGTYSKTENQWVWGNNATNATVIKPSLFGVKVICSQFQNGKQFWPRDCFSWVIDCRDWVGSHLFP